MKLKIGIMGATVFLLLLSFSYTPTQAYPPPLTLEILKYNLGWQVSEPTSPPLINSQKAMEIAQEYNTGGAREIRLLSVLITRPLSWFNPQASAADPSLKDELVTRPVWIISYEGLKIRPIGAGGPRARAEEMAALPDHYEGNVIIDATTGEPLEWFTFR